MDTVKPLPLDQFHLQFFVALHKYASLTVTAQKLGLSTSGASRMLSHLRDVFNEPLFNRCREGLTPTAKALELLPRIETLLSNYDDLFRPQCFDPRTVSRKIRIACSDNASWDILGRVIPLALEKSPELEFEIIPIEANLVPRLRSGEIDFGIFPAQKTAPGVHSAVIYESQYRYVVRRGHPLETLYNVQKELTQDDLRHYRFVSAVIPPGAGLGTSFSQGVRDENYPGPIQVQTAYILSQPNIIAHTDLVGMMPESILHQFQESGIPIVGLCPIFHHAPHRPYLLWHDRNDHDPVTAWIRALFVHAFHQTPSSASNTVAL